MVVFFLAADFTLKIVFSKVSVFELLHSIVFRLNEVKEDFTAYGRNNDIFLFTHWINTVQKAYKS